jgi:ankyrin repeat protein
VNANHVDKIAQQTPLFYAAREGHLEMCKILIEAGCDLAQQDTSHKLASHYAKKYSKNDVFEYLSNEYQMVKDQRKFSESRQDSNPEEKVLPKQKKKPKEAGIPNVSTKAYYRLYRSDAFGNSNEVSQAEYEELLANYP